MPEYIERDFILPNGVFYSNADNPEKSIDELLERIASAPAADVEVVRHGEWVCVNDTENVWMCDGADGCGGEIILLEGTPLDNEWERCPYCGARMDGKGEGDG